MVPHVNHYLANIISWAEKGSGRHKATVDRSHRTIRPRTPHELAYSRKYRVGRRRTIIRVIREWVAAISNPKRKSRLAFILSGVRWRVASGTLVCIGGMCFAHVMSDPVYFADAINLSGSAFVPGEEIFRATRVAGVNVLWLNPEAIETRIEEIPGAMEAEVEVQFPAIVNVYVKEREPVLVWRQAGVSVWVDSGGGVFPQRFDVPWLLSVTVDDTSNHLDGSDVIPVEVVVGATQLKDLRPNIELLHYDSNHGLSYEDGRHWRGYFGVGGNMDTKLLVYETLISELERTGVNPTEIYVADLDTVYYVE